MSLFRNIKGKKEIEGLVAVVDITNYTYICKNMDDQNVAILIDEYFELVSEIVDKYNGITVKNIGDALLMVFEKDNVDNGVICMLKVKEDVDSWLKSKGINSQLEVQINFGKFIAGQFGPKNNKKFDIMGLTVNTAFTLDAKPFAMTTSTFRKLSSNTRKLFKKHTPPITYIRLSDKH